MGLTDKLYSGTSQDSNSPIKTSIRQRNHVQKEYLKNKLQSQRMTSTLEMNQFRSIAMKSFHDKSHQSSKKPIIDESMEKSLISESEIGQVNNL